MSIAKKLTQIAENEQKVYDAGYQKGKSEGGDSDAAYEEGYTEGYNKGMMPLYYIGSLSYLYYNATLPENSEIDLRLARLIRNDATSFINGAKNLKRLALTIESSNVESISVAQFARSNEHIEIIDFSNLNVKINDLSYFALGAPKLKSVYGALDLSLCTKAAIWLNSADALEDIEFVPNTIKISIDFYWCAYLTDKSVDSIIDGLADLTGSTVQKVTFHSTIMDKLTTEQFNRITAKNWTMY